MFEGGVSQSCSIFPIRVVYMPVEQGEAPASILISVSKLRCKMAVKRNRVKRQIREAYRKNKYLLVDELQRREKRLAIAFIYLSDELTATAELEEKMKIALSGCSTTYSYLCPLLFPIHRSENRFEDLHEQRTANLFLVRKQDAQEKGYRHRSSCGYMSCRVL